MTHGQRTSKKAWILMSAGLLLTAGAVACAGYSVPVVQITAPTSATSPQSAATQAPTAATGLQVAPTATAGTDPAAPTATAGTVSSGPSFARDVLPIFQANCTGCHGAERASAGIDLSSIDGVTAAEGRGVILPGDAADSPLVQAVQQGRMPRRGTPLSSGDIQTIMNWINAGAPNN